MADKVVFKMFQIIFLFVIISNVSLSLAANDSEDKCNCYNLCSYNYTVNSVYDIKEISICQRGCRFFTLIWHSSRGLNREKIFNVAKEGCLLSCSESYANPVEAKACNFGCTAIDYSKAQCMPEEVQIPQITYSVLIEESDFLIHPGEPEPDDSLTDPGLRKQIQKTLVALLDATPKIPEIKFKNLPVKNEKLPEFSHNGLKCPKFYGLDSKFEFRNGKIIIGDLYLFVGVLIFVIICFLLGHHIETRNIKKQIMESTFLKKDDFNFKEPPLIDTEECEIIIKENFSNFNEKKNEIFNLSDQLNPKCENNAIFFHDEEYPKKNKPDFFLKL